MSTRSHVASIDLDAPPDRAYAALVTPSAIRIWWSAARAIVDAGEGGIWAAAWGDDEDAPEYITTARVLTAEAPRRLVLGDYRYFARSGPLPFEADFTTEFVVEPHDGGSRLTVRQDGFPADAVADAFYEGCERGWRDTLASLAAFLSRKPAETDAHDQFTTEENSNGEP